jgi:hypothetical protein
MSGGITQLVAVGAQDTHLVGNPEVSFFQSSYKRHSNFSSVIERQVIQNTPANNGLSSIRFERKGDLLSYVYLVNDNSGTSSNINWSTAIDKVELYIGGQLIDTQHYEYSASIHTDIMANSFSKSIYGPGPGGFRPRGSFLSFQVLVLRELAVSASSDCPSVPRCGDANLLGFQREQHDGGMGPVRLPRCR